LKERTELNKNKEDNFTKRLYDRDNEIRDLKNEVNLQGKELDEIKQVLYHKNKENEQMAEDIHALTMENQYVNAELIKLNQTKETLKEINEDLQTKEKYSSHQFRASQHEKEDFINSYKKVCFENERIIENMGVLTQENKEMYSKIQLFEQEIYGSQLKLNTYQQNEKKFITQIQGLERNISSLTLQLESAQGTLNQFQRNQQNLLQDVENAKNVILNSLNVLIYGIFSGIFQFGDEFRRYGKKDCRVRRIKV
jgi:chromosome segregation ATPase